MFFCTSYCMWYKDSCWTAHMAKIGLVSQCMCVIVITLCNLKIQFSFHIDFSARKPHWGWKRKGKKNESKAHLRARHNLTKIKKSDFFFIKLFCLSVRVFMIHFTAGMFFQSALLCKLNTFTFSFVIITRSTLMVFIIIGRGSLISASRGVNSSNFSYTTHQATHKVTAFFSAYFSKSCN